MPRPAAPIAIAGASRPTGFRIPGSSCGVEIGKAIGDRRNELITAGNQGRPLTGLPIQIEPVARPGKHPGCSGTAMAITSC
jgi:hypothetical protein